MIIRLFIFGCMAGVLLLGWAVFVEPNMLEVTHYKILNPKMAGIRIVFVADLHVAYWQEKRLSEVIQEVNVLKPDLVILGGDYVKGHKKSSTLPIETIAKDLAEIKSTYGTFAVLGNHDWAHGGGEIAKALSKQNIRILRDENTSVEVKGRKIYIAGLEDPVTFKPNISKALDGVSSPVILISHSPDTFPDIPDYVDLTLAGHTHGGQVKVPFYGAVLTSSDYGQRYAEGLIKEGSKQMIVTRGIGTSILPIRFNCLPEFIVIDFE